MHETLKLILSTYKSYSYIKIHIKYNHDFLLRSIIHESSMDLAQRNVKTNEVFEPTPLPSLRSKLVTDQTLLTAPEKKYKLIGVRLLNLSESSYPMGPLGSTGYMHQQNRIHH